MRVKINNIEMDIEPADLQKLLGMGHIAPTPPPLPIPEIAVEATHEPTHITESRETPPQTNVQQKIDLIQESGMTLHTIVMVARRILQVNTTGKRLGDSYDAIAARAAQWLTRPIKDIFPILFIAEIRVPPGVKGHAVVGLNSEKQIVILAIEAGSDPMAILKKIQARGLRTNSVEIMVLPLNEKIEEAATKVFPNAVIQRDWLSVIAAAPPAFRPEIKEMMFETSVNGTKAKLKAAAKKTPAIRDYVEPHLDELLTYFESDKSLWRVLRGLMPVERLEAELRRRSKNAGTPEDAQLLISWIALRLQFYWYKIPVDSTQLSSLTFIKEQIDTGVASVRVPTQKSHIRRRPPERSKER